MSVSRPRTGIRSSVRDDVRLRPAGVRPKHASRPAIGPDAYPDIGGTHRVPMSGRGSLPQHAAELVQEHRAHKYQRTR